MGELDAVVAVTGATAGIGAATVRALAEAGGRVVASGRRRDRLDALVDEFGESKVVAETVDVTKPDDSRRLVETAVSHFGRLDAIVLNAGIGMYGGILDHTDDECAQMVDVNVSGTVYGVRAAVPALVEAGGGDIVIVSSVAGVRGGGNEAVYAGTKAAQLGLAGCLDRELREKGIRVTSICPAAVNTEFAIGSGRIEGDPWLDTVLQPEDVAHAILTCLTQPRHVRTTQWTMWSMAESS
jgi:NADP-dependent 3-hydroxy acid dehydrogenase YdfG